MVAKTHEQLVAESNARLDRLHAQTMQVLAGVVPEDAPVDFVHTDMVKESNNGLPWWWGPEVNEADVKLTIGDDGKLTQA